MIKITDIITGFAHVKQGDIFRVPIGDPHMCIEILHQNNDYINMLIVDCNGKMTEAHYTDWQTAIIMARE